MKTWVADLLICPACLPREHGLILRTEERARDEILLGSLDCPGCASRYPITDGIADLLPASFGSNGAIGGKYEQSPVVSSYLWSHYADLFGDPDVLKSYEQWGALVEPVPGLSLDMGCATGRFAFELASRSAGVVGIDSSRNLVRAARELMIHRRLRFALRLEGQIRRVQTIEVPSSWDCDSIDFLRADACNPPFRTGTFHGVASLNLLDKVPRPLRHLQEADRVAGKQDAQLLVSDPFSWSEEVADPKDWLGGKTRGKYSGSGWENLAKILEGGGEGLTPPWSISARGSLWWKIRTHQNHFELIRSWFLKAGR